MIGLQRELDELTAATATVATMPAATTVAVSTAATTPPTTTTTTTAAALTSSPPSPSPASVPLKRRLRKRGSATRVRDHADAAAGEQQDGSDHMDVDSAATADDAQQTAGEQHPYNPEGAHEQQPQYNNHHHRHDDRTDIFNAPYRNYRYTSTASTENKVLEALNIWEEAKICAVVFGGGAATVGGWTGGSSGGGGGGGGNFWCDEGVRSPLWGV
ncbi:hypothetical protein BDZ88DRAFT_405469 [Geranomyces variabilis]|nr:hypothetical protein BDZ88DRAFT_405469 [Geranomyces variabilis]